MTKNAGERLFEAAGLIPDEFVLEAAEELVLGTGEEAGETAAPELPAQSEGGIGVLHQDGVEAPASGRQDMDAGAGTGMRAMGQAEGVSETAGQAAPEALRQKNRKRREKPGRTASAGRYLKYLPVAACLFLVFGGSYYMINHNLKADREAQFTMSSVNQDSSEGGADNKKAGAGMDSGQDISAESSPQDDADESGAAADSRTDRMMLLPVRNGSYDGPVFPVTATGDTQKLKTVRTLKGKITAEQAENHMQPLFQVTDEYRIKNTSDEDKTLQVIYPFTATLNRDMEMDAGILEIDGQEPGKAAYSFGDSIASYETPDSFWEAWTGTELEEYQEQALEKEADWSRQVSVYTFSNIRLNEASDWNQPYVAGITVPGEKAQVLSFGFDHSFETGDGASNYCFFEPEQERARYLIVTGELAGEPQAGFYANLDCEEPVMEVRYEMECRKMSYAKALRLCADAAASQMEQDYAQGIYDAGLPEYMTADAAYKVLTIIGDEDDFYYRLNMRYGSSELTEVFDRMFAETRIVYAMATVTVPAGKTIQVTARTQKQQPGGRYVMEEGYADMPEQFRYDILSASQSRLRMQKESFRLKLSGGWQVAEQDMKLKHKKGSVWQAGLRQDRSYFTVKKQEQ